MTILRNVLGVVGALALLYAGLALWIYPWLQFGLAVAVCAGCVIGLEFCRAVEKDRMRKGRDEVWQRRIKTDARWDRFYGLKPWPTDDEERV